jgi:hypothetical protein
MARPNRHSTQRKSTTMTTQPINGLFPAMIQSPFGTQGNFELVTTYPLVSTT